MTQPASPDHPSRSLVRHVVGFAGLVALYMAPAVLGVLILVLVTGRQAGANAFRYVGF